MTVFFIRFLKQVENPIFNVLPKFGVDTPEMFEAMVIQSLEKFCKFL